MLSRAYLIAAIIVVLVLLGLGWRWVGQRSSPVDEAPPEPIQRPVTLECSGDPLAQVNVTSFVCLVAQRYTKEVLPSFFVLPWDPRYERLRQNHNKQHQAFPEIIAMCHDEAEILIALRFAKAHDLPFSVRSGGHSMSLSPGMVLDVSALEQTVLDKDQRSVYCGAGVKAGPLLTYLGEHGFAAAVGTHAGLSVVGLVLGGGLGPLSRKYGLTADNVINARVILASGEVVMVNETEHSDLFWALRGGGTLGIVVGLTLQVHTLTEVYRYLITYPADDAFLALERWQRYAPDLPAEYSSEARLQPDGLQVQGLITDVSVGYKQLKNLLTKNCSVDVEVVPWLDAVRALHTVPTTHYYHIETAPIATNVSAEVLLQLWECRLKSTITLYALGGAVNTVASKATAFPHRQCRYWLRGEVGWDRPEDAKKLELPLPTEASWSGPNPRAYYGDNLPRLTELKQKYDPQHMFPGV